jgi:hypothetical protein
MFTSITKQHKPTDLFARRTIPELGLPRFRAPDGLVR